MIGVLLISHGKMAEGMLDTVQMVLGEEDGIDYVSLEPGEDYNEFSMRIDEKIRSLDEGDGVIVLADLFGASPFNMTQRVARDLERQGIRSRLVAGMNLGMIVEIMVLRRGSLLDELTDVAISCGRQGIGCPVEVTDEEDEDDY
ncbi:PTS system fructose subfamily IIA component [Coriobacterium glomerans PW2]|uniref:PTS system fructose subfamily IIA component n=1 Tax=Coriobacterium glomerans (strain ATCC 49209 / DSM 20642 / JCM 10262 / PW2) TaxID=700015 RepID=F2N7I7_CORGP|nr:PTS fructose subfamily transporter subunit IIA [Coriobacterium glomerans]AEB06803.1 PTS system fructose subfamily IIA component [Coriobacterium glomerans PW2]